VKIGPVDPEKIWLKLKKNKKFMEGKIYSLVRKFAERARYIELKQTRQTTTTRYHSVVDCCNAAAVLLPTLTTTFDLERSSLSYNLSPAVFNGAIPSCSRQFNGVYLQHRV